MHGAVKSVARRWIRASNRGTPCGQVFWRSTSARRNFSLAFRGSSMLTRPPSSSAARHHQPALHAPSHLESVEQFKGTAGRHRDGPAYGGRCRVRRRPRLHLCDCGEEEETMAANVAVSGCELRAEGRPDAGRGGTAFGSRVARTSIRARACAAAIGVLLLAANAEALL